MEEKMTVVKTKLVYEKLYFFPIKFSITTDLAKFNYDRKLMGLSECDGKISGMVTHEEYDDDQYIIVYLNVDTYKSLPDCTVAGCASHEATHVLQLIKDIIEEDEIAKEFEAYLVDDLTKRFFNILR